MSDVSDASGVPAGNSAPTSFGHEGGGQVSSAPDAEFEMPLGDDDLDTITLASDESQAPEPAQPTSPVEKPAPPTPAPTQAPSEPGGQPPTPQPPAPQPEGGGTPAAGAEPGTMPFIDQLTQYRENIVGELEKRFVVSAEDAELLLSQPEAVLPRMAANVLYEAIHSAHRQIMEFAPAVVARQVAIANAQQKAEDAFYEAWPGLKGLEAAKDTELRRIIKTYVQLNPKAPLEKRVADIGQLAHQMLGIPVARAVGNGSRRAKAPPMFQPAVGGLPGTAQTQGDDDPWAGMDLPNTG